MSKQELFNELAAKWKEDTQVCSNTIDIVMHPCYQQIIGIGDDAISFMLQDLIDNGPNHWFWALSAISREGPDLSGIEGDMSRMTDAWIEWGYENNYLIRPIIEDNRSINEIINSIIALAKVNKFYFEDLSNVIYLLETVLKERIKHSGFLLGNNNIAKFYCEIDFPFSDNRNCVYIDNQTTAEKALLKAIEKALLISY